MVYLHGLLGTGWGYSVCSSKVTKPSGLGNLGIYERTNVVDCFSEDQGGWTEINDDEAPEMENNIVFAYNRHTYLSTLRPILLLVRACQQ